MKALTLIARRWFDRTYGNTYHTVEILIDGVSVHSSGIHYGYDRQYEQTAAEWLTYSGMLLCTDERGNPRPLWQVCRDSKIEFASRVSDVARKRDL